MTYISENIASPKRALSVLFFCVLVLSGCSSTAQAEKSLDGLLSHLTASQFQVGTPEEKWFSMIGAENGFGVDIDGQQIEFYQFNTTIGSGKKALESVIKEGLNGSPVHVNENLVILEDKQHPKWNEILTAFESY
jgi:uncharacterized protein YceK